MKKWFIILVVAGLIPATAFTQTDVYLPWWEQLRYVFLTAGKYLIAHEKETETYTLPSPLFRIDMANTNNINNGAPIDLVNGKELLNGNGTSNALAGPLSVELPDNIYAIDFNGTDDTLVTYTGWQGEAYTDFMWGYTSLLFSITFESRSWDSGGTRLFNMYLNDDKYSPPTMYTLWETRIYPASLGYEFFLRYEYNSGGVVYSDSRTNIFHTNVLYTAHINITMQSNYTSAILYKDGQFSFGASDNTLHKDVTNFSVLRLGRKITTVNRWFDGRIFDFSIFNWENKTTNDIYRLFTNRYVEAGGILE